MCLDEIHIYLDTYDYFKKNSPDANIFQPITKEYLTINTSQNIMNVDIRAADKHEIFQYGADN